MLELAKSGAKIDVRGSFVIKTDANKVSIKEQAEYSILLGAEVCPKIFSIGQTSLLGGYGYEMERLHEVYDVNYSTLLSNMEFLLREYVWNNTIKYENNLWGKCVQETINSMPLGRQYMVDSLSLRYCQTNLLGSVDLLYPKNVKLDFCRIHGDPTVANVMLRHGSEVILIDPIPPRDDVPPLKEVDLAALIQSVHGWEYSLQKILLYPNPDKPKLESMIISGLSLREQARVYFWAAYKCVRIINKNVDEDSVSWAKKHIVEFTSKMQLKLEELR